MKFHDYQDNYAAIKRFGLDRELNIRSREDMYNAILDQAHADTDPITYRHLAFDKEWNELGRPYYDVYPSIIPMLTKLNLDFPGTAISPPNGLKHLLLRLPEGHELHHGEISVRSIFLSFQNVNRNPYGECKLEQGLVVGLDIGETIEGVMPVYTMRIFPLDERKVEETIFILNTHASKFMGTEVPDELIIDSVRLALTVCLINDNPEFLEQQVLAKDEGKFKLANTDAEQQKLFDRAKRRGKFGFTLGKHIEMIPHARRPHPCLVWTGKGKKIAKIILRKGSFIHKSKIEQVPTGYDTKEE